MENRLDFFKEKFMVKNITGSELTVEDFKSDPQLAQSMVQRIAFRITRNKQDSEEVAQDVILKVLEKADSFEPNAQISTFMAVMARNAAISCWRAKRSRNRKAADGADSLDELMNNQLYHTADPGLSALEEIINAERIKILKDVIAQLSPAQRDVVHCLAQGMTNREIAHKFGLPVTNIKSRIHCARLNLRELLRSNNF